MTKWAGVLAFLLMACACKNVELRKDPYSSPLDTRDHALLLQYCDKFGTTVACQVPQDGNPPGIMTVHVPVSGVVELTGCGINQRHVADHTGPNSFILPDLPMLEQDGSGCILDIFYAWNVPKEWRSQIPVRGLRGKVFFQRVNRMASPAKVGLDHEAVEEGSIALKVPKGFESQGHRLNVSLTGSSPGGFYRLFGCNAGIEKRPFQGDTLQIALSDLSSPTHPECLYYGFALDKHGLIDVFSVGLTVYEREATPLAVKVRFKGKRICYEAEKFVSIATYSGRAENSLKGCFDSTGNGVLSFYSVQGRARHALISEDKIEWVK